MELALLLALVHLHHIGDSLKWGISATPYIYIYIYIYI